MNLNSSKETGALNKTVPGPRGGDTWGVPRLGGPTHLTFYHSQETGDFNKMGHLTTIGEMGVFVITCDDLLINNIYWPLFFIGTVIRGAV